jgi:uncharacterized membrane protein
MEKRPRLHYLDWARGLATVVMIEYHALDSWIRTDLRTSDFFQVAQMIGGMPAAMFILLTGVSLVMLLHRAERDGAGGVGKVVLRRSGYILGIALLFRFQQWIFYWPPNSLAGLLRVDVLNTMAVGLGAAGLVMLLLPARLRMLGAALGAIGVAMLTPLAWSLPPGVLPAFLLAYLRGGVEYAAFPVFPWISYAFTGVVVGLAIVGKRDPVEIDRVMQWLALVALVLIVVARLFDSLPYTYYQPYNYWLTSPNLVANRTALVLLTLVGSYGWSNLVDPARFSWIRQIGITSLLIYWVHIEIVYGRFFWFFKGRLSLGQVVAAIAVLIGLMVLLSVAKTRYAKASS